MAHYYSLYLKILKALKFILLIPIAIKEIKIIREKNYFTILLTKLN